MRQRRCPCPARSCVASTTRPKLDAQQSSPSSSPASLAPSRSWCTPSTAPGLSATARACCEHADGNTRSGPALSSRPRWTPGGRRQSASCVTARSERWRRSPQTPEPVQKSASLAAIPASGVAPPIGVHALREREEVEQALKRAAARVPERLSMRRRINVGDVAGQLMGSVSAILCRRATCPVVIVPEGDRSPSDRDP